MPRSRQIVPHSHDPVESAIAAGLRYVRDTSIGITRKRTGKGWRYVGPDGRPLRDRITLKRIASLVIPPAWSNVWINPSPNGHLQAIGYDVRGRKQYRYHPLYSQVRNHNKFSRLTSFAALLPGIRSRIETDIARPGLPREKVLGTVVKLLSTTYIRIGNEEYAKQNQSFGLTTMEDRHVDIHGGTIRFHFRGKSGQDHEIELHDRRLARIVRDCQEIPGDELFQYVDHDGMRHTINSEDVNTYIREVAGNSFSAKDFRTWAGTYLAAQKLAELGPAGSVTEAKKNVVAVVKSVAQRLGNRPATCRKYYVHPVVIDAYLDGRLFHCVEPGGDVDEECVRQMVEKLAA